MTIVWPETILGNVLNRISNKDIIAPSKFNDSSLSAAALWTHVQEKLTWEKFVLHIRITKRNHIPVMASSKSMLLRHKSSRNNSDGPTGSVKTSKLPLAKERSCNLVCNIIYKYVKRFTYPVCRTRDRNTQFYIRSRHCI